MSNSSIASPIARRWRSYPDYRRKLPHCPNVLPAHWQIKRLKYLAQFNPSRGEISHLPDDTEVSFLPMDRIGENGTLSTELVRALGDVRQGFTYFRDGDVLVAKITPCFENGKGARCERLVNRIGFGTTELHILRPRSCIDGQYLELITRLHAFREQGASEMYGSAGQQRVPESFLRNYLAPLPPLEEQLAIAAFLSRETARIDALIERKERLISLLEEKRQAVITHMMTRGIGADSSGNGLTISGDTMPGTQREEIQLKRAISFITTGARDWSEYYSDDGDWFIQSGNLNRRLGLDLSVIQHVRPPEGADTARTRIFPGDVLVCATGAYTGNVAVVDVELPNAYANQHVAILRPVPTRIRSKFLAYYLGSSLGAWHFQNAQYGGTKQGLGLEDIRSIPLSLPPLAEQQQIINLLDDMTRRADELSHRIREGIGHLQGYRAALISAAVTGQIDVRGEVDLDE